MSVLKGISMGMQRRHVMARCSSVCKGLSAWRLLAPLAFGMFGALGAQAATPAITAADSLAQHWPNTPVAPLLSRGDQATVVADDVSNKETRISSSATDDGRVTIDFQRVPLRAALATLARAGHMNLVAGDGLKGEVTLQMTAVDWHDALQRVLQANGLVSQQAGNTLVVTRYSKGAAEPDTRHAEPVQPAQAYPIEVVPLGHASAEQVAALLAQPGMAALTGPGGGIGHDPRTNQLLIHASPEHSRGVRELVKQLDVPLAQVQIEARIVIAREQVSRQLGIRWGQAGLGQGINQWASERRGSSPGSDGHGPWLGMGLDLGGSQQPQASVGLGFLKQGTLLGLELNAMEQEGSSHTLSQPRVMTLDREPATIRQGQEVPYQEAGSYGSTSTSFRDAVLALKVTPQIAPGHRVLMAVDLQNDSVAADRFNGLPAINTSRMTTRVMVENGETVVLGGILTREQARDRRKIPWLGDIPALGALFRYAAQRHEQVELLVFITPNIIKES